MCIVCSKGRTRRSDCYGAFRAVASVSDVCYLGLFANLGHSNTSDRICSTGFYVEAKDVILIHLISGFKSVPQVSLGRKPTNRLTAVGRLPATKVYPGIAMTTTVSSAQTCNLENKIKNHIIDEMVFKSLIFCCRPFLGPSPFKWFLILATL